MAQKCSSEESIWRQDDNIKRDLNPLNAELNPICHLLALLGAHHIFHVSVLRVKMMCCEGGRFVKLKLGFLLETEKFYN